MELFGKKKCSQCKEEKDLIHFSMHRGNKDGLKTYCRDCETNYNKKRWGKKKTLIRNPLHYD